MKDDKLDWVQIVCGWVYHLFLIVAFAALFSSLRSAWLSSGTESGLWFLFAGMCCEMIVDSVRGKR